MSDFDIDGARKAGYSDAEITDYLGKQQNFDVGGARKSGYSDTEILSHLSPAKAEPAPREPVTASAVFQGRPMSLPAAKIEPSAPQAPEPAPLPWSDLPGNVPGSAGKFVNTLAQAFLHPVDTYSGLVRTAEGMVKPPDFLGKETPEQTAARVAPANAVGQYFSDRFSTPRRVRNTIISDPVGFSADASIPLTMGGSALARGPGIVGKVGEIAQAAGRTIDPLSAAGNVVKGVGAKAVAPLVSEGLGLTSGMGGRSVRDIPSAGRQSMIGGTQGEANATAVRENMRGAPPDNVADRAKGALAQVRADAGAEYRSGMVDLSKDRTILDFKDINGAIGNANNVGKFKGANIEPKATAINDELRGIVNDWETLNPKSPLFKDVAPGDLTPQNFHTPEGLDALKRTVGNIYASTLPHTPERVAAGRVYNAIKGEIVQQAPVYAGVMDKYDTALNKFNEASRTFSLGEKATGDTAVRKLLSGTRNNVQTNYGGRQNILNMLAEKDPALPYAIAGQAANSLLPRGVVARGGLMGSALTGGLTGLATNPLSALALPAFSPRAIGEAGYYGGKAVGGAQLLGQKAGITADRLRQLEQFGYQTGNINALAR